MFDAIFIGSSGLQTFSSGLKVISNNVANLNTPGFKSSDMSFADMFYVGGGRGGGAGTSLFGTGVMAGQTFLDFQPGETRQTGNPLDLSLNGEGFFVTRKPNEGGLTYTRAGQFEFNKDGVLVVRGSGREVLGLGAGGALDAVSLNGLRINPPKATTSVKLTGNLSSAATDFSIDTLKLIDAIGGEHTLKLNFKPKPGAPGSWMVSVLEGSTAVASTELVFDAGQPTEATRQPKFTFSPPGASAIEVTLDFSKEVSSFQTGTFSSLAVAGTNGHAVGTLNKLSFDADGTLALSYSNGQTTKGARLALALFDSNADLTPEGDAEFSHAGTQGLRLGAPTSGSFGAVASNQIESSNVDLSAEFSDLIVTQRGYQASSRIVSTANEMLQDLFELKGHR